MDKLQQKLQELIDIETEQKRNTDALVADIICKDLSRLALSGASDDTVAEEMATRREFSYFHPRIRVQVASDCVLYVSRYNDKSVQFIITQKSVIRTPVCFFFTKTYNRWTPRSTKVIELNEDVCQTLDNLIEVLRRREFLQELEDQSALLFSIAEKLSKLVYK